MIVIHHLGQSQSDRIVWLMEELGLPYELKWYHRGPDRLAPDEYLALHPAATAPVIEDDGLVLPESVAIVEHICHRHAGGRLTVAPGDAAYTDYLYWMQFNNSMLGLFFANLATGEAPQDPRAQLVARVVERRQAGAYRFLEQRLGQSDFLAGPELTCADIMSAYALVELPKFGPVAVDDLPNVQAYLERITARPAYIKAMEIAGPQAKPPA